MPPYTTLLSIFLISVFCFPKPALAQDSPKITIPVIAPKEIKDTLVIKGGQLISSLTTATGYLKMEDGKWGHSPNRIPFDNPLYNDPMYSQYKLGTENFSQININEMKVNGKAYYVLIVQRLKGYFKDKEEIDFKYYLTADYYFFDKKYLSMIYNDSMRTGKFYCTSLPIIYSGEIRHFSNAKMLTQIAFDANNSYRHRHLYDTTVKLYFQFLIHPVKTKNGKAIRLNTALAYAKIGTWPAESNFSNFESQYYQLSPAQLKAFTRPQAKAPKSTKQ